MDCNIKGSGQGKSLEVTLEMTGEGSRDPKVRVFQSQGIESAKPQCGSYQLEK